MGSKSTEAALSRNRAAAASKAKPKVKEVKKLKTAKADK